MSISSDCKGFYNLSLYRLNSFVGVVFVVVVVVVVFIFVVVVVVVVVLTNTYLDKRI